MPVTPNQRAMALHYMLDTEDLYGHLDLSGEKSMPGDGIALLG